MGHAYADVKEKTATRLAEKVKHEKDVRRMGKLMKRKSLCRQRNQKRRRRRNERPQEQMRKKKK